MKLLTRIFASAILPTAIALAQDVKVEGNSTQNEVFRSRNTGTATSDKIGVSGESTPAPHWGIGVYGLGGYIGMRAISNITGNGNRYGVFSDAGNGDGANHGIFARASAFNSSSKYGGYFTAEGNGGTKYGVYGAASGTGTNYGVYCSGNGVYTGSWSKLSDARAKKNIQSYSGALDKVMAVQVKRYDMDQQAYPSVTMQNRPEIGIIAQELEGVFPDLVQEIVAPIRNGTGKSATEGTVALKGVDYIALVPILLQAIKEQQGQLNELKSQIQSLRKY